MNTVLDRWIRVAAMMSVFASLVACANTPSVTGAGQTDESPIVVPGQPIAWSNPIVQGVSVSSTSALSESLSFQPVLATALGEPQSLLVNDPESLDQADRGFAAQYETSDKGVFWLMEEPSSMSQKDLEAIPAQCDPKQGCEGSWSLTTLDDGSVGLLMAGPVSVGVVWLRDGIYMDVIGPPDSFTADEAVTMANVVATKA